MAGRGSEKTQFKKGKSGNPAGKPPVDPIVKATKLLTAIEFRDMMSAIMKMDQADLTALMNDEKKPFIWRIYAKMFVKAYNTGNTVQMDTVLNRVVGKVPDKIQFEDQTKPDVDFLAEKLLEGLKK